jgi:hypothetical protein
MEKMYFCREFLTLFLSMNKIESFVYNRVKNNYVVKNLVRNAYQWLYDQLPNYDSKFSATPILRESSFFGFHDVTPFSADGTKHLACRLNMSLRMPGKEDLLEVGYWTGKNFSDWVHLGETGAWNYHKGCRLQWVDDQHCIYNAVADDQLCAELVDIETGAKQRLSWPIDTVSPDASMAATFSYERLQAMMPGYGYLYGDNDARMDEPVSSETGLFLIDMKANTRQLVLSLKDLSAFQHEDTMDHTFHFVTHTEFSADNRYLAFLHRWYKGTFHRTRLVVLDLQTKTLYASPTTGMVSHYHWNQENGLVAYCRMENIDSHVYFSSPEMKEWKRCGYPQLNSDGHHHFMDNDWFLVDTYPDKWRHAKLYKVNRKTDEVMLLADVKSPKAFVAPDGDHWWKCDLHPRCDRQGRWVSFDTVHTGVRSLCIMPLS